jgi:hypothetical protein
MKQMYAGVCIDLPADEFAEAAAKLQVKPLWEAFMAGLEEIQVTHAAKLETIETKAKPATTGARRGRKPKAPALVPSADLLREPGGEAA